MDPDNEGARRAQGPLALIERLDRQGHIQQSALVHRWPFRIGRSFDADLVLDDPHLAPLHAALDVVDGAARLTLGQTLNGAQIGGKALQSGDAAVLRAGQTWRMGSSTWRVRLASDALAPELPLGRHAGLAPDAPPLPAWRRILPLMLVVVLAQLFERWLDNNPGTSASAYLSAGLGTVGLMMGWSLFWALGNKLFQGRLDFKAHLRLAVLFSLAWAVLESALPLLAYAMDWPWISRLSDATSLGLVCALIWSHLVWIMPTHRRGLVAGIIALYVTGIGLNIWFTHQRTGQFFGERYASALPPPSWRLVGTQPVSVLLDDARAMKASLDRQAADDDDDDGGGLLDN